MKTLFNLIPTPVRASLVILIAVLLSAAATYFYNLIYDRGWTARDAEAQRERAALLAANERAIQIAEERLVDELTKIKIEKERLEDAIVRIDAEADADANAVRLGISANSVRRLEAVR